MKLVLNNSNLVFSKKEKTFTANLQGGYALFENYPFTENTCIILDFVTGSDVASQQRVMNTSKFRDASYIDIISAVTSCSLRNGKVFNPGLYEILVNTRYKVLFGFGGFSYYVGNNGPIEKDFTGSTGIDKDLMFGCRRITKTLPFLGKYVAIYIHDNVSKAQAASVYENPSEGASHIYLPKNINGLVWKDSVGNVDLELSNTAIIGELN